MKALPEHSTTSSERLKKSMKISTLKKLGVLALVTAWLSAIHQLIPAQSTNGQQQVIADSSAGTSANTTAEVNNSSNAELLKELQQMRARIEQVETQLKARSAQAIESSSQQATRTIQNVSLTTNAKTAPAQSDQPQPQKAEPAAPFAYADWTWLNGTPRNKDA